MKKLLIVVVAMLSACSTTTNGVAPEPLPALAPCVLRCKASLEELCIPQAQERCRVACDSAIDYLGNEVTLICHERCIGMGDLDDQVLCLAQCVALGGAPPKSQCSSLQIWTLKVLNIPEVTDA